MIGKYIEKLLKLSSSTPAKKNIDMDFLSENGFV